MSTDIEYTPPNAKVTSNDVDKVRKYVNTGLSLPTTLDSINIAYHGAVNDDGISAADLLTTFVNINRHASQWSTLETDIIKVAVSLKRFAGDLKDYTEPAIDEIKEMEGYNDYALKTSSLTEDQISMFRSPLDEGDTNTKNTYATIDEYVTSIIQSIQSKQTEATKIKDQLVEFDKNLNSIEVDVGQKTAKALASKTLQELRDITVKLVAINNSISDLRKESKYSVGEWFMFATIAFPSIGAPMFAFYFRDRDRGYNSKINDLQNEENTLLSRQAELQKVAAVLNNIQSAMRSLGIFTRGAIEGLMQIETLWGTTLKEVIASKNILSKTKDFSELTIFIIKMTTVLNRWKKINDYMADMTTAFSQRN